MILMEQMTPKLFILLWLGKTKYYSGFFINIFWIVEPDLKLAIWIHGWELHLQLWFLTIGFGYQIGHGNLEES